MNVILSKKEIEALLSHLRNDPDDEDEKLMKKLEKRLKPIKISSAKGKGRNLQQWICRRISELINISYDQSDDESLIRSREMGQSGTDVILRDKAGKLFPFDIECKSAEQLNLGKTIEQVNNNKKSDRNWMIIYKRKSFRKPIVILSWEGFVDTFKRK